MEPASATLGIASSIVTLAALALNVGRTLTTVVNTHRQYAALIYSLIGACKAIEVAWKRIHAWSEAHSYPDNVHDSSFYEQLMGAIDVGQVILGSLQQDLEPFTHVIPGQRSPSGTLRALLNESTLRDHCLRLNLQVSSVQLLLATATLPQPETRELVCQCLRPVFRKDEGSAWTIVSRGPASSLGSFITASRTEDDTRSVWSERSFAFINDLLTAPVYKRLALSALRPPRPPQKSNEVIPMTSTGAMGGYDMLLNSPWLSDSVHESSVNIRKKPSSTVTTIKHMDTTDGDALLMATDATSDVFSSSVVTDLLNETLLSSRWLPLRASLQRGNLNMEEQARTDAKLLHAAAKGNLVAMAEALDAGADINAVRNKDNKTALHMAIYMCNGCPALRFLLQYQNVNAHVRDRRGNTSLLIAVAQECGSCIQSLLDFGVSMTEENEFGISAFKYAVEGCSCTEPLLALLRHATKDGVEMDAVMALNRDALYKLCCQKPLRGAHAAILVRCGWSLATSEDNTSSLRLVLDTLKEEQWLLILMLKQTKTILEMRAKVPIWNEIFIAVTKGNTHRHFKFETCDPAASEASRKAAGGILHGTAINTKEDPDVHMADVMSSVADVMLRVAHVSQSDAVLRQLQRTRAIDFLNDHKSGRDIDQRQELRPKNEEICLGMSELEAVETEI